MFATSYVERKQEGLKAEETPLGIGFPYMPSLPPGFYRNGLVDFVELTPEDLCGALRVGDLTSLDILPDQLRTARATCGDLPMVVHGVQLSIGSVHGWNEAYLDMLSQLQSVWPFVWHSEHLGFQTILEFNDEVVETGVPLPMPNTLEAAQLIVERCAVLDGRFGRPFLLENPAHYLAPLNGKREMQVDDPSSIVDEIDLMNYITRHGRCRQLLDLHNLYCNAINHGFDSYAALDRLALDRVTEIHVAGGSWRDGFLMDAHDSIVPCAVWDLLDYTLSRARNVSGVVFEVLDRYVPRVGVEALKQELKHLRTIWERHHTELDAAICAA